MFSRIFDEWNGEVVGAKSEVNGRMQIMVGKQMMRLKDAPSWYLFERVCVAPDDYSLAAVQRYLFGAYCKYEFIDEQLFNYMAGTPLQQVAQKVELFVRASREDGMHDHLDMTFTDFQACVAGKSEQNVRKVLPSDSELGQYEFFPIEVVDSALMSLHEDDDRYQCWRQVKLRAWQFPKCWPVARLTCAGLRVLLNPVAVDDFNWEVSLKLQQVDLQTAGKCHDIIQGVERVLRRPLRLGPEQPLDLELLAHHLYRRTGMGREDWGFDIVDEIVTRWKPIAKRRTVDDDLEITEEAYTVMEAETIRECWEHAFVGCNPDAFVDYDGMRPFLQQTVAHGYGRCEKPRMQEIFSVEPTSKPTIELVKNMKESGEWEEFAHPNRRARLEYADYHEERRAAQKESSRIGKLFKKLLRGVGAMVVILVSYFLKRESGKDRPLFQVGPEYDSPATVAFLPYMVSMYNHPNICVGASGEKVFGDIAVRMRNFKRYKGNVCQDHAAYNENKVSASAPTNRCRQP